MNHDAGNALWEWAFKGLNAQVPEVIGKKLAIVFSDAASGANLKEEESKDDKKLSLTLSGNGHGALFHLVQPACYQMDYSIHLMAKTFVVMQAVMNKIQHPLVISLCNNS